MSNHHLGLIKGRKKPVYEMFIWLIDCFRFLVSYVKLHVGSLCYTNWLQPMIMQGLIFLWFTHNYGCICVLHIFIVYLIVSDFLLICLHRYMLVIYVILIDFTADDQGLIFLYYFLWFTHSYGGIYGLHIYFFVYLIDCLRFLLVMFRYMLVVLSYISWYYSRWSGPFIFVIYTQLLLYICFTSFLIK